MRDDRTGDLGGPGSIAALGEHEARGPLLHEIHARPFHSITLPKRILHFAFLTNAEEAEEAVGTLQAFCAARGLDSPGPSPRHYRAVFGNKTLRWERHNEFITVSWHLTPSDPREFEREASELGGVIRLLPQPGPVLVAVDLHLQAAEGAPPLDWDFDPSSICAMTVEGGRANVSTDFKPRADGFVRLRVIDVGLDPARAGAVTQRLLELETYRVLALLGLPEAQRLAPSVRRIEEQLAEATRRMTAANGLQANRILLDTLTGLASELEAGAAESLFCFGASRAYDRLGQGRFSAPRTGPVDGFESLESFLSRRMAPAMQTCVSIEERQINLSRKLARAAQLLRTRVEIELEAQNADLLRALSERSEAQLRLQQTVEGLSIAAVSYYVLGILSYLFQGASLTGFGHIDPKVATAASSPIVIIIVAAVVLRLRRGGHAS